MARYVSMGNSITAGYQSGGINDSTQQAFLRGALRQSGQCTVLCAFAPGTGLRPAAHQQHLRRPRRRRHGEHLRPPGRRAALLRQQRRSAGRHLFSPTDNLSPFSNSNPLTTFILGGRTQVQAMQDAKPTFVSVWIGNNDVLGAFTSSSNPGNPALVTPLPAFQANYDAMLDSIETTGASAILLSVADVTVLPYLHMAPSTGASGPASAPEFRPQRFPRTSA